jgi:hypothetical protein
MKIFSEGLSKKLALFISARIDLENRNKGSDSTIYQRKIAFIFIAFYLELDLF